MPKRIGKIFVISAPSGSGKTTLVNRLVKKDQDIIQSISMTTRSPRKGEKTGKDYYFVTEKEFKRGIANDRFLEWARNFGNFYGTPHRFVEDSLKRGKDVILSIDVQGAMQVKKIRPSAVFIFIAPPSMGELRNRLRKRNTEYKTKANKRLKIAKKELTYIPKYDYLIVNDEIEKAVEKLKAIILAERCRLN